MVTGGTVLNAQVVLQAGRYAPNVCFFCACLYQYCICVSLKCSDFEFLCDVFVFVCILVGLMVLVHN